MGCSLMGYGLWVMGYGYELRVGYGVGLYVCSKRGCCELGVGFERVGIEDVLRPVCRTGVRTYSVDSF